MKRNKSELGMLCVNTKQLHRDIWQNIVLPHKVLPRGRYFQQARKSFSCVYFFYSMIRLSIAFRSPCESNSREWEVDSYKLSVFYGYFPPNKWYKFYDETNDLHITLNYRFLLNFFLVPSRFPLSLSSSLMLCIAVACRKCMNGIRKKIQ